MASSAQPQVENFQPQSLASCGPIEALPKCDVVQIIVGGTFWRSGETKVPVLCPAVTRKGGLLGLAVGDSAGYVGLVKGGVTSRRVVLNGNLAEDLVA